MTAGPTKGFCVASAWPLHTQKNTSKRQSQLSSCHLALSANSTVHRMDQGGLYHYWSGIQPMGYYGSKPKVKGRTLGTAVRSAGRCKALLPTYIIENPPTVNAQTPASSFSFFSFFLSLHLQWGQQHVRQNKTEYDISSLTLPHSLHLCIFARMSLELQIIFLFTNQDRSVILLSIALCFGIHKMLKSAFQNPILWTWLLRHRQAACCGQTILTFSREIVWSQQWGMHINLWLTNHIWPRGFLHHRQENKKAVVLLLFSVLMIVIPDV